MKVFRTISFILLLLVFGSGQLLQAEEKAMPLVPVVDHHQHLLSPAGADLVNLSLPPIDLPADLTQLLKDRAERWNNEKGLSELYLEDSVTLSTEAPGWIKGRSEVVKYLSARFGRPYRLTPVAYSVRDNAGHVAGYITLGEGAKSRHFGYFYLAIHKDEGGSWRIASEVDSPIPTEKPVDAETLISMLDDAGIKRAVILSDAYYFDGRSNKADPDSYVKVKAENDWTAQEVAKYSDRLIAFCSFNPIKPYALEELDRCAKNPVFRGLKLHFGESQLDLKNSEQLESVRQVFAAANKHRFAIIVHLRHGPTFGGEYAKLFLNELVAAAPDVPVQVAHFWGGERYSEDALTVFGEAFAAGDPHTKNLYFDVAQLAMGARGSQDILQNCARRMRQIGLKRILYASDGPEFGNVPPREAWRAFRKDVPLTEEEFRVIANNVAPYMERQPQRLQGH